ncbi:MAG: DUF6503 family protein [Saprospiraceae bacterium]
MRYLLFVAICFLSNTIIAQSLTPTTLLEKSIAYHDPGNTWNHFQGTFELTEDKTNRNSRKRKVSLDNSKRTFHYWQSMEDDILERWLEKDTCRFLVNGKSDLTAEEIEKNRLSCDRTKSLRNYYAYIYGLPMKLKDNGTILGEVVLETTFDEQPVYGFRVTYDAEVGNDIWYFYFDKKDYHLVGYRFYHDEAKNDGEYIFLKEEAIIEGIKMPRIRTWYTHQGDRLLGTDILVRP